VSDTTKADSSNLMTTLFTEFKRAKQNHATLLHSPMFQFHQ
jgi:hypothetical protein